MIYENDMMICREDEETGLVISSNGRVFREVSQWEDKYGYFYVTNRCKNLAVHRLVAKLFVIGRTEETPVVMHKDDNPKNNHFDNLAWGTYQQNNMDAVLHGLRSRVKRVRCLETGEVFPSAREAARRMFGKPKRGDHILDVCKSRRGKAYGYHWEVA